MRWLNLVKSKQVYCFCFCGLVEEMWKDSHIALVGI